MATADRSVRHRLARGLAGLALAAGALAALREAQAEPAAGRLYARPSAAGLRAVVEIAIEPGWVLYHTEVGGERDEHGNGYPGRPLVVRPAGSGLVFAPPRVPAPQRKLDPALGNWAFVHEGRIRIYLAAAGADGAIPADLAVALSGSTCSAQGVCRRYDETLVPEGPGPDAAFADFPADLRPPTGH
jgi:hypothetical protein